MKGRQILNNLNKRYFKLPIEIFHLNLPSTSIAIYCYMASLPETFNPSVRNISKKLSISPQTVIKYVKILLDFNLILKYEIGGIKKVTKYKFNSIEEWKIKESK